MFRVLFSFVLASLSLSVQGQPSEGEMDRSRSASDKQTVAPASERPLVALVLSGGGAKGMAHVGVLRALEEMHVPVDIVVGTSAGSAVAALYALGMDVDDIEDRFIDMDWLSSFRDSPGRAYKPVRRKMEDWRYPIDPGIGVGRDGLKLGRGLVAGQNLGFILNELTSNASLVRDFDELPLRFRAVATDLETGEEVVIGDGALATAIRASMSIPGVYAPTEYNGRWLVDGGIANNLPISVAESMGADVIIAVDISDTLLDNDQLTGAFSVVGQLTTLMTRSNVEEQLELLTDEDVLIRPNLDGLTSADFFDSSRIMEVGATATRNAAVALNRLRVDPVTWAGYQQRRSVNHFTPKLISNIEIKDDSRLSSEFLLSRLRQKIGEPLDAEQLRDDLRRIYGLGYYETVSYALQSDESGEGSTLVIEVEEKSWGPNYMRFGLGYEDNFENDTRFNVAANFQMTQLNALGAEWNTGVQLGTEPYVRTEWFQPLDYGYRRFLLLGGDYQREAYSVFDDQGSRVAEVEVEKQEIDVSLGLELGAEGELRGGYQRGYSSVDDALGSSGAYSDSRIERGAWDLQLTVDTLDDPFLPSSGGFLGINGRFERPGLGSDSDYDRTTLLGIGAQEWGQQVVVGQLYGSMITRGEAGVESYVSLGGFRRLSAYARGEVTGADAALASLYSYRRFGGPVVPFFAGAGYEGGNAWQNVRDASWNDVIHSWNLFAGIDTFLGPVQLSTAYADDDHWTTFLTVGYSLESLFIAP
ncbi:patatin-like phospholipase family protein [Marinobacter sp. BGYM27]|uniref:patatin-like phospholipase family protein n=1 Tax=Marinobacter sp. BGYM27 TaxID=2975597 RepID=UPI0021A4CE19|nr:patatin-like phospholipase family protein [Marinobacter sp. BGYM27]